VLRAAQHRHEAGRLLEELPQPLALGDAAAFGQHLPRGLLAGAEHAGDPARLVANRRVAEGKMWLLRVAVAVHGERDVVHVGRLAGIGARQDRPDLVPDVMPEVVEGPAERRRVPHAAHEGVAVVVEGRVLRSPHGQHGLLRAQHDGGERLESLRPSGGIAQRRARPIVRAQECARRAAAGEEIRGVARASPAVHGAGSPRESPARPVPPACGDNAVRPERPPSCSSGSDRARPGSERKRSAWRSASGHESGSSSWPTRPMRSEACQRWVSVACRGRRRRTSIKAERSLVFLSELPPAQRCAMVVRRWAVQRPEQPSIDTFQVPEPEPAPRRPEASALPRPWRTPMATLPPGPT
jgi:hypothetical protein